MMNNSLGSEGSFRPKWSIITPRPSPSQGPQSYQGSHILILLPPNCIKLRASCKQGCQRGVKFIVLDKLGEKNFTCLRPRKTKSNLDLSVVAHLWFQYSGRWGGGSLSSRPVGWRGGPCLGGWGEGTTLFSSNWNTFSSLPHMITQSPGCKNIQSTYS